MRFVPCTAFSAALALVSLAPTATHAFEPRHEPGRGNAFGHDHDRGHDEGHLGWWWVVGSTWRMFAQPYPEPVTRTVIIQQAPPPPAPAPVVVQAPPTAYYCRATGTYYPDTMSCPGGWSTQVGNAPPYP